MDLLPWACRVSENERADRLASTASITSGLQLGSINRLKERGAEKGIGRHSTLRGRTRSVFYLTNIGTVSRATLGRLLRDGPVRVRTFPSATMPSSAETETRPKTFASDAALPFFQHLLLVLSSPYINFVLDVSFPLVDTCFSQCPPCIFFFFFFWSLLCPFLLSTLVSGTVQIFSPHVSPVLSSPSDSVYVCFLHYSPLLSTLTDVSILSFFSHLLLLLGSPSVYTYFCYYAPLLSTLATITMLPFFQYSLLILSFVSFHTRFVCCLKRV